MRLMRARYAEKVVLARLEPDGQTATVLAHESGHPAADVLREALAAGTDLTADGPPVPVRNLDPLAPLVNPSKILAIGLNYQSHAAEAGEHVPGAPLMFTKTPNSVIGPGQPIRFRAADSGQVDYEAELAVVVGRRMRDVPPEKALTYVFGYTLANDVSARDAQFADGQWARGKSFDGFTPLGPVLVSADEIDDVQDLAISCRVNGQIRQDANTRMMIFSVADILSYLSRYLTLVPGDLVLTGTPDGVGFARTPPVFLGDGDVVEVEMPAIGTLRNPVAVSR